MFEQIKSEAGNVPAKIEYIGGKTKYGVIIDDLSEITNSNILMFITYNNLQNYELTENPKLIEKLDRQKIVSIDTAVK